MLCLRTSAKHGTFEALGIDDVDGSMAGVGGKTVASSASMLSLKTSAKHGCTFEALGIDDDDGSTTGVRGNDGVGGSTTGVDDSTTGVRGIDDGYGSMAFLNGFVAMDHF